MKYLFQFTVISLLTFISDVISNVVPLPIPAGIYGLVILFVCLWTKIIKIEWVSDVGDWLLFIMPVMFVPTTVNLITKWDIIKSNFIGLIVACILSTIVTMFVTGFIAQIIVERSKNKSKKGG